MEWCDAIVGEPTPGRLPPRARHLALTLATFMNPDGSRCWPGQERLAAALGVTHPSTVQRATEALEEAGFLEVVRYAGGRSPGAGGRGQRSHLYVPVLPPDQSRNGAEQMDEDQSRSPAEQNTGPVPQRCTTSPAAVHDQSRSAAGRPSQDHPKTTTTTRARDDDPPPGTIPAQPEVVVDRDHEEQTESDHQRHQLEHLPGPVLRALHRTIRHRDKLPHGASATGAVIVQRAHDLAGELGWGDVMRHCTCPDELTDDQLRAAMGRIEQLRTSRSKVSA